jgi:hypothetical protein
MIILNGVQKKFYGLRTGVDRMGRTFTEFVINAIGDDKGIECYKCGEPILSGWLCEDGACCDMHIAVLEEKYDEQES